MLKRLLISFVLVLNYIVVSNVSADVLIPGNNCFNFNRDCYDNCIKDINTPYVDGTCESNCCGIINNKLLYLSVIFFVGIGLFSIVYFYRLKKRNND